MPELSTIALMPGSADQDALVRASRIASKITGEDIPTARRRISNTHFVVEKIPQLEAVNIMNDLITAHVGVVALPAQRVLPLPRRSNVEAVSLPVEDFHFQVSGQSIHMPLSAFLHAHVGRFQVESQRRTLTRAGREVPVTREIVLCDIYFRGGAAFRVDLEKVSFDIDSRLKDFTQREAAEGFLWEVAQRAKELRRPILPAPSPLLHGLDHDLWRAVELSTLGVFDAHGRWWYALAANGRLPAPAELDELLLVTVDLLGPAPPSDLAEPIDGRSRPEEAERQGSDHPTRVIGVPEMDEDSPPAGQFSVPVADEPPSEESPHQPAPPVSPAVFPAVSPAVSPASSPASPPPASQPPQRDMRRVTGYFRSSGYYRAGLSPDDLGLQEQGIEAQAPAPDAPTQQPPQRPRPRPATPRPGSAPGPVPGSGRRTIRRPSDPTTRPQRPSGRPVPQPRNPPSFPPAEPAHELPTSPQPQATPRPPAYRPTRNLDPRQLRTGSGQKSYEELMREAAELETRGQLALSAVKYRQALNIRDSFEVRLSLVETLVDANPFDAWKLCQETAEAFPIDSQQLVDEYRGVHRETYDCHDFLTYRGLRRFIRVQEIGEIAMEDALKRFFLFHELSNKLPDQTKGGLLDAYGQELDFTFPQTHRRLISAYNGLDLFNRSFRFLGVGSDDTAFDLYLFNDEEGWRQFYGTVLSGLVGFGYDYLGNVFLYDPRENRDDPAIVRLDADTGELEPVARNFLEFVAVDLSDTDEDFVRPRLLREWQLKRGQLGMRECLSFQNSPVLGGERSFQNLTTSELSIRLHMAGQIASQARQIPEGAKILGVRVINQEELLLKVYWDYS